MITDARNGNEGSDTQCSETEFEPSSNPSFTCPCCPAPAFSSLPALTKHLNTHHPDATNADAAPGAFTKCGGCAKFYSTLPSVKSTACRSSYYNHLNRTKGKCAVHAAIVARHGSVCAAAGDAAAFCLASLHGESPHRVELQRVVTSAAAPPPPRPPQPRPSPPPRPSAPRSPPLSQRPSPPASPTVSFASTTPADDYDLSVFDDVDFEHLKRTRLQVQDPPRNAEHAHAVAQPLVFGWNRFGRHDTSAETLDGARGLRFYYIAATLIFARAADDSPHSVTEMREMAALVASSPTRARAMWDQLLARANAPVDTCDPPASPSPSVDIAQAYKGASRFAARGEYRLAGRSFHASPVVVGDEADGMLRDLTPQRPPPPPELTMPVPGVDPFDLERKSFDAVFGHLPQCRAGGSMYDTFEILTLVYKHGGADGQFRATRSLLKGRIHNEAISLLRDIRAVVIRKPDGRGRPLGLGECYRRGALGCLVHQERPSWAAFYTSPLPADAAAQAAEVAQARVEVEVQQRAFDSATEHGYSDAAFDAREKLSAAEAALSAAEAPRNFPVNFAFSSRGAECVVHTVNGWHERDPCNHTVSDDVTNMYNETCRDASFVAMREHMPHIVPAVALFYGQPALIRPSHSRSDGPLLAQEPAADVDGPELVFDGSDAASEAAYCLSTTGGQQGCPLATHFSCLPYFISLNKLQKQRPSMRICGFADDTYMNDEPARLYPGYADKRVRSRQDCKLESALPKVVAYSPEGNMEEAPADIPGSALHPDGVVCGFKCVGAFVGESGWCAAQLDAKLQKRLSNLDNIDKLADSEGITNTRQFQYHLQRFNATCVPNYFMRAMPPTTTLAPASNADCRIRQSWERLVRADCTPPHLRDMSWAQAQLTTQTGGLSLGGNGSRCSAAYVASVLQCLPTLQRTSPVFATASLTAPAGSPNSLPMLADVCIAYETLRESRTTTAATYAAWDEERHYTRRGGCLLRFRPKALPPAKALPALTSLYTFDAETEKQIKPASQRQLSAVVNASKWVEHALALATHDDTNQPTRVRRRESARFIAVSQPGSGSWLDMPCDGTGATRIQSGDFVFAAQRRMGYFISEAAAANDALASKGETPDRYGDSFVNAGEHNRRHHTTNRAIFNAEAAVALGPTILGDKEKPGRTAQFNADHVPDIASVGAAADGADICHETKVPSPLIFTHSAGQGIKPPSVGDRFAFGNTEEPLRIKCLGCKGRGLPGDPPFNSAIGKGRIQPVVGDYRDALVNKGNRVIVWVVESTGGIAPEPYGRLRRNARFAKSKNARDGTTYGFSRLSPRSYLQHHTQRISAAAVVSDAQNGRHEVSCLKQRVAMAA